MRLISHKIVWSICFLATLALTPAVEAEEYRNYSVTLAKTDELKVVATELRSEFTDQLRRSSVYGPLIVRTVWVKSSARKINRRARIQRNCDWLQEIGRINQAVCEMEALLSQAQLRAAYGLDRPIDPVCLDCIYQLIGRCKGIVYCLCVDGGFLQPAYQLGPTPATPAPGYIPETTIPVPRVPTPAIDPSGSELTAPGPPPLTLRRAPWQSPAAESSRLESTAPGPRSTTLRPAARQQPPGRRIESVLSTTRSAAPPVYSNGPFGAQRTYETLRGFGN